MKVVNGALVVGVLALFGCEPEIQLSLPACDTPQTSEDVLAVMKAREAMNVVPMSTGDMAKEWETLCVRLSFIAPIAMETGAWSEAVGDDNFAAGSYAATWRKVDGAWALDEDLRTIEGCAGTLCP